MAHPDSADASPEKTSPSFIERVINVNRVAKVVRRAAVLLNAIVAVGDGKGRVASGLGKANEVATRSARPASRRRSACSTCRSGARDPARRHAVRAGVVFSAPRARARA